MLSSEKVGVCALLRVFLLFLCGITSVSSLRDVSNQTLQLMSKYPLIDGHNDLALRLRALYHTKLSKADLHRVPSLATDINRLQAGHVGGQVFAAYVMCHAQGMDAVRLTLEQIDLIRHMCTKYPEFELVTVAQALYNTSRIACLLSVEGGHSIDSSLPTLRMLYQLGVRSMGLTHTCNTPWAESSSNIHPFYQRKNNSLTNFGKAVVDEMNRLGMIIDLSHSSWATARAVLERSRAPVIFSHSSSYEVCRHHRNVPLDLLLLLRQNGGIIMVNFHSGFVTCSSQANVSDVADHFDYIRSVVGAESIGIGGDFDGADRFPQGLQDVSKYPVLIQELLLRNWSEEDLAAVLRLNFLRVFQQVEKVRDELHHSGPSEVEIPFAEAQNSCRLKLSHPMKAQASSHANGALLPTSAPFQTVVLIHCLTLQMTLW